MSPLVERLAAIFFGLFLPCDAGDAGFLSVRAAGVDSGGARSSGYTSTSSSTNKNVNGAGSSTGNCSLRFTTLGGNVVEIEAPVRADAEGYRSFRILDVLKHAKFRDSMNAGTLPTFVRARGDIVWYHEEVAISDCVNPMTLIQEDIFAGGLEEQVIWSRVIDGLVFGGGEYDTSRTRIIFERWNALRLHRCALMALLRQGADALQFADRHLQAHREIVMAAVQSRGRALASAHLELKADREIVMAAVQSHGGALQYAASGLRADRAIVLTAVENYGYALGSAHLEFRSDREIVMAAVQSDGGALQYAALELREDREIVMAAVQKHGGALIYAALELREDREIVTAAAKSLRNTFGRSQSRFILWRQ